MASPLARAHALVWGSSTAGGQGGPRLGPLPPVRRAEGVGRVLRAARADAGEGRGEPAHRARRSTRRASRSCCSTARSALPGRGPPRPGRHRQPPRRLPDHGAPAAAGRATARVRRLPDAAATVDARAAGYREALHAVGRRRRAALAHRLDPADAARVSGPHGRIRPDGDRLRQRPGGGAPDAHAARARPRLPRDVRLVGVDDLEYASLLPVPLTTLRQPTRADRGGRPGRDARPRRAAPTCPRATSCCTARSWCARRAGTGGEGRHRPARLCCTDRRAHDRRQRHSLPRCSWPAGPAGCGGRARAVVLDPGQGAFARCARCRRHGPPSAPRG